MGGGVCGGGGGGGGGAGASVAAGGAPTAPAADALGSCRGARRRGSPAEQGSSSGELGHVCERKLARGRELCVCGGEGAHCGNNCMQLLLGHHRGQ